MKRVKTEEGVDDAVPTLTALSGHWIEKRYKSQSTYCNIDLPPQCQDQRWPKHFLLTLYLWAGSQDDLWQISDASLIKALQCIMDEVYDTDLLYKVTSQGSVFGIVGHTFFHITITNRSQFKSGHTASGRVVQQFWLDRTRYHD
jgi:hypothetical protein